jgi:hypothetical protein
VRRVFGLLVAGLLAGSVAAPAAVMAKAGSTYTVPGPTGIGLTDTANIQAGLDWCATHGPGCTVQLGAGTYVSSQLLEYNFNGTFKGAGEYQTTIQAMPNLLVNTPDAWVVGECAPDLNLCRYPDLIMFVDGNVEVSALALDFPATDGTETTPYFLGGTEYSGLITALEFTGDTSADASVDRVSVTGRADHTATNVLGLGFNVIQGIMFDGFFPAAPFPSLTNATRSGTFTLRNSTVQTVWDAVLVQGAVAGSQVTIGGSPGAGNRITDVDFALDLGAANSTFDISYNDLAATNAAPEEINHVGVFVEPSGGAFAGLVSRLSQFSIHDNTIAVNDACGCSMFGMWLQDARPDLGAPAHWFTATIKHNTISLPATYTLPAEGKAGIDANNVTGATISGNTITATATGTFEGIGLWGNVLGWPLATGNSVIANDLSGVALDPTPGFAFAQVYLDPYTANNHVVCAGQGVSVLDQGTGNKVTGCGTANSKGGGFHHAFAPGQMKPKLHP